MLRRWSALAGALILCLASAASAQESSEDTRTQYPRFLADSYFGFNVGSVRYVFSQSQLEPGFRADAIETPHLAARVDLFGHYFSRHLSAQVTYMRPARYVSYVGVNGEQKGQVKKAYGGVTLVGHFPLDGRLAAYAEGGWGVTSRGGFQINGKTALQDAHFASVLLGGGLAYSATPNIDVLIGATFLPGRDAFQQPSTRLIMTGIRYRMRPLPDAEVEENRSAGYAFPKRLARLGFTTNSMSYGVNTFFSRTVPIFWGGHAETRYGFTTDYQRNVFHTKKWFAFDVGGSASFWKSNGNEESFGTLSVYPHFRIFFARAKPLDAYISYSLAGPTFISRRVIDGFETGEHFTFQDFMGVGMFFGRNRRLNAELGIKHYSNGNIFTRNASVKVPLTFTVGRSF